MLRDPAEEGGTNTKLVQRGVILALLVAVTEASFRRAGQKARISRLSRTVRITDASSEPIRHPGMNLTEDVI